MDCGLVGPASWASSGRAVALAELGDADGALAAQVRAEQHDRRGFRLGDPVFYLARVWIAVLGRDPERADAAAGAAIEAAARSRASVQMDKLAHNFARLGLRSAAEEALAHCSPPTTARGRAEQRIYTRLSIASRAELADALRQLTLPSAP